MGTPFAAHLDDEKSDRPLRARIDSRAGHLALFAIQLERPAADVP
jgi:hypothetical protein